jgi:glycosyltransferase involved in cell wall biosynthesis
MNVLMLAQSSYPQDIRVRQEALKLTDNGHRVSVIALRRNGQARFEIVDGVSVYRLPDVEFFKRGKHSRSEGQTPLGRVATLLMAVLGYGFEFVYFTLACFGLSFRVSFRDRFDVIHTHNPPDTLFLVAGFWKLLGKSFVYDHHDLSPDLFIEKYGRRAAVVYRILLLAERISCRTADFVIATNASYRQVEMDRDGVEPDRIFIVRNGPDLREMRIGEPFPELRAIGTPILCYLGAINVQDGVDRLLEVLDKIVHDHRTPGIRLLVIGDGDYLPKIRRIAEELRIAEHVIFTGLITDRGALCRYLSTADIFVDAAPTSFLNDRSTFIKHMEYMVFEKPVVSFALKESIVSLGEAGWFVEHDDTDRMAQDIIALIRDPERRRKLGTSAGRRVKELSWDVVSKPLVDLYAKIGAPGRKTESRPSAAAKMRGRKG